MQPGHPTRCNPFCYVAAARRFVTPPCTMSRKLKQWGRLNVRSVRCKPCNKAHSALQRIFTKEPKLRLELKENFKNNESQRSIFMKRARGLMGDQLHELVRGQLTRKKKVSKKINLKKCLMEALRDLGHMHKKPFSNQKNTTANMEGVCTHPQEDNIGPVGMYTPPLQH